MFFIIKAVDDKGWKKEESINERKKNTISVYYICNYAHIGMCNGTSKTEEAKSEQKTTEENGVVPIKPITAKAIDDNPYMAKSDANVHQDCYNSDTTDEVLPVDIYPEINVSYEKVNPNASPAVFFDTYGHAVVPFQGGLGYP